MKVFIDHGTPFFLAHGGFQLQIEQTKLALAGIGVDVDWVRWWDDSVLPDVIHWFGSANSSYIRMAQAKGIKVVMSELRSGLGSRSPRALAIQAQVVRAGQRWLPKSILERLSWDLYQTVDAATSQTIWEAKLAVEVLGAPPDKIHVIANGVEEEFFANDPVPEHPWLVCTATIHPRKRVLELAKAAVEARTPVWIVGKPYAENHPYYAAFLEYARAHGEWVRYEGPIDDRRQLAEVYRGARGFVLVSTMESQSFSSLEAAASGCALLLADLPWARTTFGEEASYAPNTGDAAVLAATLQRFYKEGKKTDFRPLHWPEVARQYQALYASLL